MLCTIRFQVAGDEVASTWSWTGSATVETMEDAVDHFYPGYRAALQRIWKTPVESDIKMEVVPNRLLSVVMRLGDRIIPEREVLEAFFRERLDRYMATRPKYVIEDRELKNLDTLTV